MGSFWQQMTTAIVLFNMESSLSLVWLMFDTLLCLASKEDAQYWFRATKRLILSQLEFYSLIKQ